MRSIETVDRMLQRNQQAIRSRALTAISNPSTVTVAVEDTDSEAAAPGGLATKYCDLISKAMSSRDSE